MEPTSRSAKKASTTTEAERPEDIVVFWIIRDSVCAECGEELGKGRFLAEHACQKYSGRIGRSAAAKELQADAVDLAVRAHVRHVHTRYDALLATGVSRQEARALVADVLEDVLQRWQRAERQ